MAWFPVTPLLCEGFHSNAGRLDSKPFLVLFPSFIIPIPCNIIEILFIGIHAGSIVNGNIGSTGRQDQRGKGDDCQDDVLNLEEISFKASAVPQCGRRYGMQNDKMNREKTRL